MCICKKLCLLKQTQVACTRGFTKLTFMSKVLGSKTKKSKQPLKKAEYIDEDELGSDSDIPR